MEVIFASVPTGQIVVHGGMMVACRKNHRETAKMRRYGAKPLISIVLQPSPGVAGGLFFVLHWLQVV
jgi:hypothetical protein